MKILIIEDNRSIAHSLRKHLSQEYVVETASKAQMGLQKIATTKYAAIVLDLGLPDINGLQVCRTIRESGDSTPILVLTGIDSVNSRVTLLRSGADDYLTKPFDSEELKARIGALSRRRNKTIENSIITLHDVSMDVVKREVTRSGRKIVLRRKEFDILKYLLINKGRSVTREMILDNVWETGTESWNNTIDVHIKYLRDKIDRPFSFPIIKTAYGIGYSVDDSQE
jgi:DNA-binding response OmpR family regulator